MLRHGLGLSVLAFGLPAIGRYPAEGHRWLIARDRWPAAGVHGGNRSTVGGKDIRSPHRFLYFWNIINCHPSIRSLVRKDEVGNYRRSHPAIGLGLWFHSLRVCLRRGYGAHDVRKGGTLDGLTTLHKSNLTVTRQPGLRLAQLVFMTTKSLPTFTRSEQTKIRLSASTAVSRLSRAIPIKLTSAKTSYVPPLFWSLMNREEPI